MTTSHDTAIVRTPDTAHHSEHLSALRSLRGNAQSRSQAAATPHVCAVSAGGTCAADQPIDSRKPFRPGSDPLDPLPFSDAERDDLVERARTADRLARSVGGSSKRGVKIKPGRLAELRADRAAAQEQARAHARSLRVSGAGR